MDENDGTNQENVATKRNNNSETDSSVLDLLDKRCDFEFLKETLQFYKNKQEVLEKKEKKLKEETYPGLVSDAMELEKKFSELRSKLNSTNTEARKALRHVIPCRMERPDVYNKLQAVEDFSKASYLLKMVKSVQSIHSEITSSLSVKGKETKAVELCSRLYHCYEVLSDSECHNFKQYIFDQVVYWNGQLLEKLKKDFQNCFVELGWPSKLKTAIYSSDTIEEFKRTVSNLIESTILSSKLGADKEKVIVPSVIQEFPEAFLPIEMLIRPLRKRFWYNFFTGKETSNNPEWYFSQVQIWLRDLVPFIRTYLEAETIARAKICSVAEFMRGLLAMLVLKMDSQLKEEINDAVFVCMLEGAISFENDVVKEYMQQYFDLEIDVVMPPLVSTVFAQPKVLKRWITLERKACYTKFDEIFTTSTAWIRPYNEGPPELVDLFLALIKFITERFAHLKEPSQKIQFLYLLLSLLDDFRIRCIQKWKSHLENEDFSDKDKYLEFTIADSINYVHEAFESWEDLPFFASLSAHIEISSIEKWNYTEIMPPVEGSTSLLDGIITLKQDVTCKLGDPERGLFSYVGSLYSIFTNEIMNTWSKRVTRKLWRSLKVYISHEWSKELEFASDDISEGLMASLEILRTEIFLLKSHLSWSLREKWLKKLAVDFDEMFLETVILSHRFSNIGVKQLQNDISLGILPCFELTNFSAALYMKGISTLSNAINLSPGSAQLLYSTLTSDYFSENEKEAAIMEAKLTIGVKQVAILLKNLNKIHSEF